MSMEACLPFWCARLLLKESCCWNYSRGSSTESLISLTDHAVCSEFCLSGYRSYGHSFEAPPKILRETIVFVFLSFFGVAWFAFTFREDKRQKIQINWQNVKNLRFIGQIFWFLATHWSLLVWLIPQLLHNNPHHLHHNPHQTHFQHSVCGVVCSNTQLPSRSEFQSQACVLGPDRNRLRTRWKSQLSFPNSQSLHSVLPSPQEASTNLLSF